MVNWTTDKDQAIIEGIFTFYGIKSSKDLLSYLAKEVGDGCTAKAVSHRLGYLRKSGKTAGGKTTIAASKTTRIAPKGTAARLMKPLASKTPALFSRGKVLAKTADDLDVTSDDASENNVSVSHSAVRKHTRASKTPKSYAESDHVTDESEDEFAPDEKRVKEEPVEDEGITSTTVADTTAHEDDEEEAFV